MIIRKKFKAEVAHRVLGSYTKRCQGLHGHSYRFEVFLKGNTQDDSQMLMDFNLLKDRFHNFLDSFDHSILVWKEDSELLQAVEILNPRYIITPYNTTAEQVSRHIYFQAEKIDLPIYKVIAHETETGFAEFAGDDDIRFDLEEVIFSEAIRKDWQ